MSLKFVLLTLIDRESRSGYDLVQTFDSAVGYFWNASHQQVYRELASLTNDKMVKFKQIKQTDKPDKKIYSLSSNGKIALQTWLQNPLKVNKTKDLLLVKLMNANNDNVDQILDELERNKQASKAMQTTYIEIENQYYSPLQLKELPNNQVMIYAALRKGLLSIEAHLTWLDEVITLMDTTFQEPVKN